MTVTRRMVHEAELRGEKYNSLLEWWEIANAFLELWGQADMTFGPARDYYEAGMTPEMAALHERKWHPQKRRADGENDDCEAGMWPNLPAGMP